MKKLTMRAYVSLLVLFVVIALLLFGSAGTLDYWQAWTFLVVYFAASFAITLYLVKKDPELLRRRMRGGPFAEKQMTQKIIMSLTSLGFIGLIVVPALDHQFGWSQLPPSIVLAGDVLVALGFLAISFVFRENSFSSATVELTSDQKVISSGPYGWVRHPMYAGALVMLLGMPVALGSWWGLLVVAVIFAALVWRLIDEERFLSRNLPGYAEYRQKVRYRLLPLVW
jgi:protein-S-isoprenylcysteine O-methyltransferase Ste14